MGIMERRGVSEIRRILFICTGNTCRSPMAEALMRKIAQDENISIEVKSAGISALHGGNASHHAYEVLSEKGIAPDHRSQRVTRELIQWADVILTMTSHHKHIVLHQFPESLEKAHSLKEYAFSNSMIEELQHALDQMYVEKETKRLELNPNWSEQAIKAYNKEIKELQEKEESLVTQLQGLLVHQDVHDPFGGSLEEYRSCAQEIEQAIRTFVKRWRKEDI